MANETVAINVSLAFCMGTDLDAILNSPSGQPMSTIFFNSFGKKGTLVIWVSGASGSRRKRIDQFWRLGRRCHHTVSYLSHLVVPSHTEISTGI